MLGYDMIALRGRASGTVKLYKEADGTLAEFALRGRARAEYAFFVGRDGSVSQSTVLPRDGRCRVEMTDICGAAVFGADGGLVCMGALGSCGGTLKNRLDELRLRALDKTREKQKESGRDTQTPAREERKGPASSVTEDILLKARELFSPAGEGAHKADRLLPDGATAAKEKSPGHDMGLADASSYAVPNPFPRTYPNSYWQKREGESTLYGTATTRRGKLSLTAFPAGRGVRRQSNERYIIDVNGRGYLVREQRA